MVARVTPRFLEVPNRYKPKKGQNRKSQGPARGVIMSQETLSANEKSDRHGWSLPHVLVFPAVAGGMWMLYHPWPTAGWLSSAFWIFVTGYSLLSLSSCFHETSHQTFSSSTKLSIWVGRLIGTVMLIPYTVYRESHIRHHAYLNTPSDWELWPYSDPKASLGFRRVFVWFDLLFGIATTPYIYGRIFFAKDSPITSKQVRRTIWMEYALMAVAWAAFLLTLDHFHVMRTTHGQWVLALLVMSFLQTGRKLTEHLGMKSYDPILGTRTVVGRSMLTRWTTYLQFDIFIHGPHHRHPRLPHGSLKAKMNEYIDDHREVTVPVFDSYWKATLNMLPSMWRNPGVGVNVGAPLPKQSPAKTEVDPSLPLAA